MKYQRMATSDSQSLLALGDRRSVELSDERGIDVHFIFIVLPGCATVSVRCAYSTYYARRERSIILALFRQNNQILDSRAISALLMFRMGLAMGLQDPDVIAPIEFKRIRLSSTI
jgi:hypothetical protein